MDPLKCTSSGDTLFDGEVTVRVAENDVGISSSSSRTLRLLVQLCDKSSGSKELLVRLTDEQDPFTLYTCLVCDDDYLALRQHQGLLIDFVAFPHKFVDLVNTCLREKQSISPRFMLVLKCSSDGGSSTLEVVEVNVFKHLCHLALNLAPASTQLKLTYLADCCKALKAKAASKEREMVDMEQQMNQQVQHLQGIVNKTSSEVQHLRSKMDQQTAMSSERQAQRLSKEREKMLKLQSDADRKADRERRELEARLNNCIEHLQAKVASLTTENSEISERRHRAESSVKELRGRLSNVEGELERCRQELTHTKKHNAHLDQDYQAKCKMYTTWKLTGHKQCQSLAYERISPEWKVTICENRTAAITESGSVVLWSKDSWRTLFFQTYCTSDLKRHDFSCGNSSDHNKPSQHHDTAISKEFISDAKEEEKEGTTSKGLKIDHSELEGAGFLCRDTCSTKDASIKAKDIPCATDYPEDCDDLELSKTHRSSDSVRTQKYFHKLCLEDNTLAAVDSSK